MRCVVTHSTKYSYSEKVLFANHIIRLTPKHHKHVTLNSYRLKINPKPYMLYRYEETDGSHAYNAFFDDKSDYLEIEHVSDITLEEYNPWNFIVTPPEFLKIPFKMTVETDPDLMPFLRELEPLSDEVKDFIYQISNEVHDDTLGFTTKMCSKIREIIAYQRNTSSQYQLINRTFHTRKGSCRDMAVAFLQICRFAGIPARFVSGYTIKVPPEGENPDLHSWIDLYIRGGGWVAFDPTLGLIPAGTQVALTSSADPKLTMPITGGYYGNARSKLDHLLTYKFLEFPK
ncbi:MAG TPA: hypothetical protein DD381_04840 [Lentisphaeria bacterium]|nr:MAG: hypothetical protein A2X47_01750 [Lentisphaerae bacterium GWF2_38_69]HBM15656.1 hypothetical protein [Lentisphaeria bacterium]